MFGKMSNLTTELNRFYSCSKRLKAIFEETKQCFDEIKESGNENGQSVVAELLQEEQCEIENITNKKLGIIIFGQDAFCKACVINEIFNREIFPTIPKEDNVNFRMVHFKYGEKLSAGLALPDGYDLAENLEAYNGSWSTIPQKDLEIFKEDSSDTANDIAVLEVTLNHSLLRKGSRIIVTPSLKNSDRDKVEEVYTKCCENISPVLVYAFSSDFLTKNEITLLEKLKTVSNHQPVCFVRVPDSSNQSNHISSVPGFLDSDQTTLQSVASDLHQKPLPNLCSTSHINGFVESNSHDFNGDSFERKNDKNGNRKGLFEQLCDIGYLSESPGLSVLSIATEYYDVNSELIDRFNSFNSRFVFFVQQNVQRYLINAVTVLSNAHERCLRDFVISAFDMARDMMITPKKLTFAKKKEQDLFKSLMDISVEKTDEIKVMIGETIQIMKPIIVQRAEEYEFLGVDFGENGEILTTKGLKICTYQIQELVLGILNQGIAGNLVKSVNVLRDSYTGTLSRCLESLERIDGESGNGKSTSDALKQILTAAYHVEIGVQSSSSFLQFLLERMKQLVQAMPWHTSPKIDVEWKKRAAEDILTKLSEARLAKSISGQLKERLNKSHDAFSSALRQLEQKHTGRLDKIEEGRLKLRKTFAPRVAKVALESTSLKDYILYGMPQMGREVGRGQYGVVYSCDKWSNFSPCAIKSVVPPDEKHWNDLALEFYYTKNIPEHDRIVALRGSVIDYMYGGGSTPAVLLIMDRLQRDLYSAIKQSLDWPSRLQVAIDVVEGIRYLHSQGLVHRDIKLKNVLLDVKNRGKITDLGFCKPEAMMSGSIVGTPIHMAPELFTGRYDNSVDVYAFGVLFWYVCAGHVKLPSAYEKCDNKDQLWTSVKKGLRPERLAVFDADCWQLMEECWESEPMKRPLLGEVETRLKALHSKYMNAKTKDTSPLRENSHAKNLNIRQKHSAQ